MPPRSATTCEIPQRAVMSQGTRPESVISPRVGRRLGRYLTVTVPPSSATSGIFPSKRARYRSSIDASAPMVR